MRLRGTMKGLFGSRGILLAGALLVTAGPLPAEEDGGARIIADPGKRPFASNREAAMDAEDSYLRARIAEYGAYVPQEAVEDANKDIARGKVKVFFLALEESSRPLSIQGPVQGLPESESVPIGAGCIDPVHSEDCPAAYRQALRNAVQYGILYNAEIARRRGLTPRVEDLIDLGLENETSVFLGDRADWGRVRVELRDLQGPFGGRDILLAGSGAVLVRAVRGEGGQLVERRYRLRLPDAEVGRSLRALAAYDPLAVRIDEAPAEPDTARPEIILTNPWGRRRCISFFQQPVPPAADPGDRTPAQRIDAAYREILRYERMAEEGAPALYSGAFTGEGGWKEFVEQAGRE
ncbi:MAG: hypothetical protein AB1640_08095 [bacterium]